MWDKRPAGPQAPECSMWGKVGIKAKPTMYNIPLPKETNGKDTV